ncbi:DNA-binding transcriptional regulator, LysR family [Streptomyces zhaozhouensis]|uniref:DNA-binding transcriptional regulator, LysR family n=1 Tax=Streptomyces zhaozhouensis TaxID=1300267 RepID=A0A286DTL0_9ACTN|nr:LysR family transcriptional regulator [Streptomyces zhaozhouensis]SOD62027.1 DNA-binding transcriptional regulator, LysR family [Streptomyces zhaozhouensis]
MSSSRHAEDTKVTVATSGDDGPPAEATELTADAPAALLAPRLAQFAGVARHEHFTRAAEELGVPQPTLSRAVARLEADLGVALLARHGRTVSLTPVGRAFARSVERALAEVARAAETARADADPGVGKVAFGFLHTMGPETMPALIRAFRETHPGVRFALVQSYGEDMIERMRSGELDLCLTSPVPDAPDLVTRRLDEQRLYLVVPADHRLAGRRRVRLAETAEESFVTLEPGYGLRRLTDDLCAQAGFRPRIAFEGEEPETLRGLVAAGLGVALLPPATLARPGVRDLSVTAPRAVREIGVAWMARRPETPPVAAFRRFLLSRRGALTPG